MKRNLNGIVRTALVCLLPAAIFLGMHLIISQIHSLHHDPDEGLNVMVSCLIAKGYRLYREIWLDQPPVFYVLQAGLFKLFGPTLLIARYLAFSIAALLLFMVYQVLRQLEGGRAALLAVLLLVASDNFLVLSVVPLNGICGVMFGTAALWFAVRSTLRPAGHSWGWLIGSSAAMALAIQAKVVSVILAVPVLTCILLSSTGGARRVSGRIRDTAVWSLGSILFLGMIAWLTSEDLRQVLMPHILAEKNPVAMEPRYAFHVFLGQLSVQMWPLVPLTLAGMYQDVRARRWPVFVPFTWLATSCILLSTHKPIFFHYAPLITVPLCWSAATGILALWKDSLPRRGERYTNRRIVRLAAVGVLMSLYAYGALVHARSQIDRLTESDHLDRRIVSRLELYKDQTRWVFADLPIYPFAAGLLNPPPLALVSSKRQFSGYLPDAYIAGVLDEYRPEQILLGRLRYGPELMSYIDQHYDLVWKFPTLSEWRFMRARYVRHYVLKPLRREVPFSDE